MIILVCGGRDYQDAPFVDTILRRYIIPGDVASVVIEGGARGADTLAREWCKKNVVHCATVPALWGSHRHAAGPIRNRAMLLLRPELVIAFPGGPGTRDMVRAARAAGIETVQVSNWFD